MFVQFCIYTFWGLDVYTSRGLYVLRLSFYKVGGYILWCLDVYTFSALYDMRFTSLYY